MFLLINPPADFPEDPKKSRWTSILWGLGAVAGIVTILFSAIQLPFMEVVQNNIQSGIDADAYFYSEVEDFRKHEAAIAEKRRQPR